MSFFMKIPLISYEDLRDLAWSILKRIDQILNLVREKVLYAFMSQFWRKNLKDIK